MKTLYLDLSSGISGDMFIAALIDLGVDARQLEQEFEKLRLEGYHLHVSRGRRASLEGVKFDVHLASEHDHGTQRTRPQPYHAHSHAHTHEHGRTFTQIRQLITESSALRLGETEVGGGLPASRHGGGQDSRTAAGAGGFP